MNMKYITLDIEGDISSKICHQHFTEDTLYRDPDTISWLCSVYNGNQHKALGIRLPAEPRKFISRVTGNIESTVFGWHNPTNTFEDIRIKDCGTYENRDDYINFLQQIANILNTCYNKRIIVFYKGYYDRRTGKIDKYDKEQLTNLFKKYNISCHTECMVEAIGFMKKYYNISFNTPYTVAQKGQKCDNNTYMNKAVEHNLEDSKVLWECINNILTHNQEK